MAQPSLGCDLEEMRASGGRARSQAEWELPTFPNREKE